MKEEKSLIKIPLQFFGGSDDGDDFDDDFGYDDEEEDSDDGDSDDSDENENADDAADGGKTAGDHADLIADLKALGFKGDDLDALKADVKARREAREKGDKAEERRAAQAAGKSHIKGSKPHKGADGSHSEGVSERRVRGLAETLKCTPQRARALLEKHTRQINGG
jgi:hypothetical protein